MTGRGSNSLEPARLPLLPPLGLREARTAAYLVPEKVCGVGRVSCGERTQVVSLRRAEVPMAVWRRFEPEPAGKGSSAKSWRELSV